MTPSPPPRAASAEPPQEPTAIAAAVERFLAECPRAQLQESGKVLVRLQEARFTVSAEHGRCTLHVWSAQLNLVRTLTAAVPRGDTLRLTAQRLGHSRPSTLHLAPEPAVGRAPRLRTSRETARAQYVVQLQRVLARSFPEWQPVAFRTAMDLEKSFGPAYARGSIVRGQQAWAVIGINPEESQASTDGILTLGILWLHHCRSAGSGRYVYQGLRLILPRGSATLTLSRLGWLSTTAAQWELYELDPATEELEQRDPADHGNLITRLIHLPDATAARERFAAATAQVMATVPADAHPAVEQRLRSSAELAFLLHGLEFARIRLAPAGHSFALMQQITFGDGASETELTPSTAPRLAALVAGLVTRRTPQGSARDLLFRAQPERWLESRLRTSLPVIDGRLLASPVYSQVPAFAASDRGMLDLLGVANDGRLAVVELKASDDLHLALQGLDYWIRVRWHHLHTADASPAFGQGELQRHGYFPGMRLAPEAPRLYLVAPALEVHPATETVLRYLSPGVEWYLIALDQRWRRELKVVWRRSSGPSGAAIGRGHRDGHPER
ncbi:MAG: hypothetical protein KGK08_07895 [Acidobacteriota bacterium]|nr:hypothetical protein [Acidobacteriota bacterium]